MFTFGREHELACAIEHIGNTEKAALLIKIVNLTHDYLEGSESCIEELKQSLFLDLSEGSSGVWESSGSWLYKLSRESVVFHPLWKELADHKYAKARFRIAAFINKAPIKYFLELSAQLLKDKSTNVRIKIAGELSYSDHPETLNLLEIRKKLETNGDVLTSIEYSISTISNRAKHNQPSLKKIDTKNMGWTFWKNI